MRLESIKVVSKQFGQIGHARTDFLLGKPTKRGIKRFECRTLAAINSGIGYRHECSSHALRVPTQKRTKIAAGLFAKLPMQGLQRGNELR